MKSTSLEHWSPGRWLAIIVGTGLAIRLALLYLTRSVGLEIVDEQHYAELARSLLRGDGFAWQSGEPTTLRPPLFPWVVSAVWYVTGEGNLLAVRLVQIAMSLVNVCIVYLIGRRAFSVRVALIGAALYAIYPSLVALNFLVLTEVQFNLLLSLVALFFLKATADGNPLHGFACGVTLALAALTRSIAWPFFVLLLPLTLLATRGGLRRKLAVTAVLTLGFSLAIGPWSYRSTSIEGKFVLVDTMGGLNLYMGNYEHTPLERAWAAIGMTGGKSWGARLYKEHPESVDWGLAQKEAWAKKAAMEFMLENPALTVHRSVIKFMNLWGLERAVAAGWQQGLWKPHWALVLLGTTTIVLGCMVILSTGLLGMVLTRPIEINLHWFVLLLLFVVSAIHALVFGHARYHLPLIPFLCLYTGAFFASRAWRQLLVPNLASGAAWTGVVLLLAIWTREVLVVDRGRIQALLDAVF